MGLFDGIATRPRPGPAAGPDFASTAHVARLLRAPVVLVVDAAAAGRSVAALVAGFAGFDPRVRVAGVILNRVGSQRHERVLKDAVEPLGIGVFGAIRRTDAAVTPSRHLGLVPAAERRAAAERAIAELADLIASSCDLDGLRALAWTAPPLASSAVGSARGPRRGRRRSSPASSSGPAVSPASARCLRQVPGSAVGSPQDQDSPGWPGPAARPTPRRGRASGPAFTLGHGRAPPGPAPVPFHEPSAWLCARCEAACRGGPGSRVHVQLHRACRAARGRRCPSRPVRPAHPGGTAGWDRRPCHRGRLPRDVRTRTVGQRAAAPPGRGG